MSLAESSGAKALPAFSRQDGHEPVSSSQQENQPHQAQPPPPRPAAAAAPPPSHAKPVGPSAPAATGSAAPQAAREKHSAVKGSQERKGSAEGEAKPAPVSAPAAKAETGASSDPRTDAPAPAKPSAPPPLPAPAAPPAPPIPDIIVFHKSPDGDDFGFRAVLEAITNPQMFSWTRFAVRVVAFVSFPMFTIAVHPKTMFKLGFPQMLIASVIATSTARTSLGEQIGLHSWTWRGVTFMLVLGTIFDTWNVSKHVNAWWGLIAAGIFLASLCTHGGMRRFMFLYYFVYMMELRMFELYFGGVPVNNAAWLAADLYMGTFFGIAALLFPYPILTSQLTDMIMDKIFEGLGKMLMGMQSFLVTPMVHAAVAFYGDASPFQKIEHVLAVMAPLLWFTNWEPWEFPTRNPVRRLKLSLFRRIMALTYAAFSIGREVAALRRDLADRVEMQRIRMEIWLQAHNGEEERNSQAKTVDESPAQQAARQQKMARDAETSQHKFFTKMKEAYGEDRADEMQTRIKTLRANTNEHYKAFTAALMQVVTLVGKTKNTPERLVKDIPFQMLAEKEIEFQRNRRLEVLQLLNLQSRLVAARTQRRADQQRKNRQHDQRAKGSVSDASGTFNHTSGNLSFTANNMSLTTTAAAKYAMEKEDAMEILDYQDVVDDLDVYLAFQEMFFAMLLSMISGELVAFGEMMAEYKPEKTLCRRLVEFYLIEPWNDFWSSLWSLVHLDTPSDIRTIKDAIKMTCAFLAACAFNFEIWIPQGGMYFFGTTILLGLPVEEETIGIGVCRMAGNTLGCALGYLAYHNTKNLSEMIGLILSLSFVCHLARNHPVFGQCFFYAAIIAMAGMATALNTLELLVRVLASCYTVMAYALCCTFIFPTNPIKILWGYRMKISKAISETIDDVAITARLPLLHGAQQRKESANGEHSPFGRGNVSEDEHEVDDDDALLAMTMRSVGRNDNGVDQMLAELNVQVTLVDKLQAMCTKWTPFAENYPLMRGTLPYPKIPSLQVHGAQLKMVASLRLLVFGVQLMHRPRSVPPDPTLKRLFSGSVADFLADFAGAVRLVFQNFIDSLQTSRTWSYPASLMFHGVLMKLRVRLRAILFETFVLIGIPAGRSTLEMNKEDLENLLRDTSQRTAAKDADPARAAEVRVGDNAAAQGGAASTPQAGEDNTDGQRPNASFAPDPNASFAGRYLLARRAIEEYQHQNNLAGDNPLVDSNAPTPRTMGEVQQSAALQQTINNLSMAHAHGDGSRGTYQHHARLQEVETAPHDMFPFRQEDPGRELGATLRRNEEEELRDRSSHPPSPDGESRHVSRRPSVLGRQASGTGDKDAAGRQPDGVGPNDEFAPVQPKKSPSKLATAVSRLVRPHEEPDKAALVPRYQGPGFSYREDELDLPVDTDFLALVAILSSCGTFMDDVQSLSGPVNSISGYQKQLHESSLCLGLIDKLSDYTKKVRKENYDRYHLPPPPPEKRTQMNAQADVWREWRF